MRILGILPSSKDITMSLIDTDNGISKSIKLEKENYSYSSPSDQSKSLVDLHDVIEATIVGKKIDKIVVLKAGTSPTGSGASPERIKSEAAIQIAAKKQHIECILLAPQTLAAAKKKDIKDGAISVDERLSCDFSSKAKRDAAHIALLQATKVK